MKIEEILACLLREVTVLIENGHLTERKLARMTGISQPHVHHILNGKRKMTAQVADIFLEALGMDARQLVDRVPNNAPGAAGGKSGEALARIPLLRGAMGPADPAPDPTEPVLHFPFPIALLESPGNCVAVRTGRDELLLGSVQEGELAVLALVAAAAKSGPNQGSVYAFRGSWVLDVPGPEIPRRRAEQLELRARRRLLQAEGMLVARVLWFLRGIQQFTPSPSEDDQ